MVYSLQPHFELGLLREIHPNLFPNWHRTLPILLVGYNAKYMEGAAGHVPLDHFVELSKFEPVGPATVEQFALSSPIDKLK
jgi:hypothetical protein